MKWPFRMITLKQILSQICPGDWFFSLDLKDAYFHIQIAPPPPPPHTHTLRRLLRFAFEGVAYQYTAFGLSMAPRTFMKCMDAALSPLRQMAIHILNYLDDWLILAQSEDKLLSHRSMLLSHLECLGLRVNFAKSTLRCPSANKFSSWEQLSTGSHARTFTGNSAACGFIQTRSPLPSQSISENAGPHGISVFSTSVGPASHAAPSVLTETSSSSRRSVSRWARPALQLWPLGRNVSGWNGLCPWAWSAEGRWSRQMPPT